MLSFIFFCIILTTILDVEITITTATLHCPWLISAIATPLNHCTMYNFRRRSSHVNQHICGRHSFFRIHLFLFLIDISTASLTMISGGTMGRNLLDRSAIVTTQFAPVASFPVLCSARSNSSFNVSGTGCGWCLG